MKLLIRLLCLVSLLTGLNLSAQTPPTSDDFTTPMLWTSISNPPQIPKGGGTTVFGSDVLNYVVTSPTADDAAGRVWVPRVAPSDSNWSVDVFVNLGSSIDLSNPGQFANLNLGVAFSTYSMMVSIDRFNNGGPSPVYQFEGYNGSTQLPGAYEDTTDLLTTATLRLAYTAASGGTLAAQFSTGGEFQTVGSVSNITDSSNWNMSASDTFNIILIGASGTKGAGAGPTISSGTAYFDNFASSGLEARPAPVPEPSTYAAIIGLLALGFAIYRRR